MSESAKIDLSKTVDNKSCPIFSSVAQNELFFGQSQYSNLFRVSCEEVMGSEMRKMHFSEFLLFQP